MCGYLPWWDISCAYFPSPPWQSSSFLQVSNFPGYFKKTAGPWGGGHSSVVQGQ